MLKIVWNAKLLYEARQLTTFFTNVLKKHSSVKCITVNNKTTPKSQTTQIQDYKLVVLYEKKLKNLSSC